MRIRSFLVCRALALLAFAVGLATHAPAATHETCTARDAKIASSEVGQQEDWEGVYRSFKRFRHCDEGAIAEEYSYAIGHLLAHDWNRVDDLVHLAASDREFAEFVVLHIDENIPEEDAQLIVRNSRRRCPSGAKWLCRSIADY